MMSRTSFSEPRISRSFAMSARTSLNSATIFSRSRPVRRWRRMSRMACAWMSSRRRTCGPWPCRPRRASALPMNFSSAARVIETSAMRRSLASCGSLEARMILITRSRLREGEGEAAQEVGALLRLLQVELRAPDDDGLAVVDEVAEEVVEGQDARLVLDDREEDDPEGSTASGSGRRAC